MRSETRHIIGMMKATGNQPGVIAQWKRLVEEWISLRPGPDADAMKAFLPFWQVRPFYTAAELAPLWPALAIITGFTSTWPAVVKSAKRLEYELDFFGLPRLRDYEKRWREYFIVERIHYWKRDAHENDIKREFQQCIR